MQKQLLIVAALTAAACGPPLVVQPEILKQVNPSPFVGVNNFIILPPTFVGFVYDGEPEPAWMAKRSEKQNAAWMNDKVIMGQKLMKRFALDKKANEVFVFGGQPAPGQFAIAINYFAYDGVFRWTAEFHDASGAVVDAIRDPHNVNLRTNTWMAEEMGAVIAANDILAYLRQRGAFTVVPPK